MTFDEAIDNAARVLSAAEATCHTVKELDEVAQSWIALAGLIRERENS